MKQKLKWALHTHTHTHTHTHIQTYIYILALKFSKQACQRILLVF